MNVRSFPFFSIKVITACLWELHKGSGIVERSVQLVLFVISIAVKQERRLPCEQGKPYKPKFVCEPRELNPL